MTGLSRSLTKRLKLKVHTDSSIPRADIAAHALADLTIHLGPASWTAQRVSIAPAEIDLLDQESGEDFHTDVVLGTSLFEQFQVTVDPEIAQIHIAASGTPAPALAEKLPTVVVLHVALAFLQVMTTEGHAVSSPFLIDSGSRPNIMLGRNFWASRPPLAVTNIHGVDNEQMILKGFRIGNHILEHVPALKPAHEEGVVSSEFVGGVLGAPVLNRFIVVYDLSKNAIWIKPTTHLQDAF